LEVTSDPTYYDRVFATGHRDRFPVATNEFGERPLESVITVTGRRMWLADSGIDVVRDEHGSLRQVLAPQCLADIVTNSAYKYTIDFYSPPHVGVQTNGLYTTTDEPFISWTVENPTPATNTSLRVTRIVGSSSNVHDFTYTSAVGEWDLVSGGGLRKETKSVLEDEALDNSLSTYEIRGPDDAVVHKKTEYMHYYPEVGAVMWEKIDPDGANLMTTNEYYEESAETGRYMRVKSRIEPDGSWTTWDYDDEGRKTVEIKPFENSAFNSSSNAARATLYSYTPVDEDDDLIPNDRRPRTKTEMALGEVVGRTFYAYKTISGECVEIVEQCGSQSASYGDVGNLRTTRTYYSAGSSPASAGLLKSVVYADGRKDSYEHEFGTYTSSTNPASCSFTAGDGDAYRIILVHGTQDDPDGLTDRTTKETRVFDGLVLPTKLTP